MSMTDVRRSTLVYFSIQGSTKNIPKVESFNLNKSATSCMLDRIEKIISQNFESSLLNAVKQQNQINANNTKTNLYSNVVYATKIKNAVLLHSNTSFLDGSI